MYLRCPNTYFRADGTAQCPLSAAEKAGYQETGFFMVSTTFCPNTSSCSLSIELRNFRQENVNVIDSGSASAFILCSMLIWGFIFRAFSES